MKEYSCPHCGANLLEVGLGGCFDFIEYLDKSGEWVDGEVADFVHHFCPECGRKIPAKLGEDVEEKLTEEK